LDLIEELVNGSQSPVRAFDRYAAPETKVKDRTPKNILLDLYEIQENYVTTGDDKRGIKAEEEMEIEDLCQPVENGRFGLKVCASGKTFDCPLAIEYDPERRKYRLTSAGVDSKDLTLVQLESVYRTKGGLPHESVLAYLNRTQSFRVLPKSPNVIYVHGEFYRPVIKIGRDFDPETFQVGKTLLTSSALNGGAVRLGFEKGKKCLGAGEGWEVGSLFHLIDKLGNGDDVLSRELGNPDILVCDDMETEMADFILADKSRKLVAFIHAKASDRPRSYSASAITEVCGQAIKNIHYLSMFNEEEPTSNLKKWKREWKAPPKVEGSVKNRIRRPLGVSPEEVWDKIASIIRDPLARREVWLFLGQTLSKSALEKQLRQSTDEAIQAAILLHGTMASIASIDAKMRVFCSE
jgi:hypothetical protein